MSTSALTGLVAVVTGASRGIGRGVAVHLAHRGATVAGIARPSEDLQTLAATAVAGRLVPYAADVTSLVQVEDALAAVAADFGPPGLVVMCAGVADALGPTWTAEPQDWWDAVTVDLLGTMITARSAIRRMLPLASGRLVTVYGNLGERQQGHASAFAAAKAGVARLTESLACELAGTGIKVFAMHPGFVRTPMTERLASGDQGRAWLPGFGDRAGHRWGGPGPAADLVEAIAGGAADELTGRVLWAGDDIDAVAARCRSDPDYRRLRLVAGDEHLL
jgi:NAD(P)-dependent dehydrogenase (short-subunit alcohol dehydrogenase family)